MTTALEWPRPKTERARRSFAGVAYGRELHVPLEHARMTKSMFRPSTSAKSSRL
jgi:hypothetical protein